MRNLSSFGEVCCVCVILSRFMYLPQFITLMRWHNCMSVHALRCLGIGTPEAIGFPFVSGEKLVFSGVRVFKHIVNEAVIYLSFGTPKGNEFSIWNGWRIYCV